VSLAEDEVRREEQQELPAVLTVEDMAAYLRIGRGKAYELVHQRQVPHVRVGRYIRIPREALLRWLEGRVQG